MRDETRPGAVPGVGLRSLQAGSLGLLMLMVLAAGVLGWVWAACVLPDYNSEARGDLPQHALMVYDQAPPAARWAKAFDDRPFDGYPRASHWLAARLMPLLGGDPWKAIRVVCFASVLCLLTLQYTLLCRTMPAGWALVALVGWQ